MVTSGERTRAERLCRGLEVDLRLVGGDELVYDALREAEWYGSLYFHWDGSGEEPLVRLRARIDILTMRLENAHAPDNDRT